MRQEVIEVYRVGEVVLNMPVCHPAFQPGTEH